MHWTMTAYMTSQYMHPYLSLLSTHSSLGLLQHSMHHHSVASQCTLNGALDWFLPVSEDHHTHKHFTYPWSHQFLLPRWLVQMSSGSEVSHFQVYPSKHWWLVLIRHWPEIVPRFLVPAQPCVLTPSHWGGWVWWLLGHVPLLPTCWGQLVPWSSESWG